MIKLLLPIVLSGFLFAFTQTADGPLVKRFGANDFIEYWSAYQIYADGKNPYDPTLLLAIERQVGREADTPLMMWNPPWLLTIFSPILRLDFSTALVVWLALSALCWLGVCLLALRSSGAAIPSPALAVLVAFISYPAWNCLALGQLSLFLAAALALVIYALDEKRDVLCGLALSILSLKPHLAYLLFIAILWAIIKERRYKIVLSFLLSLLALILLTQLYSANALAEWIHSDETASNAAIPVVGVRQWQVATLVGFLRTNILEHDLGQYALLPAVIVPSIAALGVLGYLVQKRPKIIWSRYALWLIPLSLFTSPFGWFFDQSLLLYPQATLVGLAFDKSSPSGRRWLICALIILLHASARLLSYCCFTFHHQFFWFSLVFLLIVVLSRDLDVV